MTNFSPQEVGSDLPAAPSNNKSLVALYAIFFLSGASALIFETLFFVHAGLAFGNSVWASALALASFMAGLTIGAGLASKYGDGIANPVLLYAVVEIIIAISGVSLVFFFPFLTTALKPIFHIIGGDPFILNAIRLTLSFTLFLFPTICMGVTLPILVKALGRGENSYGKTLGKLYGLNTLGAFFGALLGEGILIEFVGIKGAGLVAGSLNLMVATIAIIIAKKIWPTVEKTSAEPSRSSFFPIPGGALPPLVAAFLAGGTLLALEVVWFRFIQMFSTGSSFAFAVMLSVVLAGIGIGGLSASRLLDARPEIYRSVHFFALANGFLTLATYSSFMIFTASITSENYFAADPLMVFIISFYLMFPVSLFSGLLFTFLGHRARHTIGEDAKTTGQISMANTTGAMLGALLAGFVLLPFAGVDLSILIMALTYFAISIITLDWKFLSTQNRKRYAAFSVLFAVSVLTYPSNTMLNAADAASLRYRDQSTKTIAIREGLLNTLQYLRYDYMGEPVGYRLVTNSHSMAATYTYSLRYMKLYVYWPLAIKPESETALLICFGSGSTAKALTEIEQLKSIDIVDLSKDIFEMSVVVYGNGKNNPLNDERVKAYVEDGRFFLTATDKRYDLITAEPPPTDNIGTVNLYTQEFFQLIYDRLNDGGIVSYWLPLSSLNDQQTKSILKAFCNVFSDCSLWEGSQFDWMMIGTRGGINGPDEKEFGALWQNPKTAGQLKRIGIEKPEQLGALFIMDSDQIRKITADEPPLTDNYPKRLAHSPWRKREFVSDILRLDDPAPTKKAFASSSLIHKWWPDKYRIGAMPYFDYREIVTAAVPSMKRHSLNINEVSPKLHRILTETDLVTPVKWLLGSEERKIEIVEEAIKKGAEPNAEFLFHLGVKALSERDYELAYHHFTEAENMSKAPVLLLLRIFTLCEDGKLEKAASLIANNQAPAKNISVLKYFEWLNKTFDLKLVPDLP